MEPAPTSRSGAGKSAASGGWKATVSLWEGSSEPFPFWVRTGGRDWGPETGQGLPKVTCKPVTSLGSTPRALSPDLALLLASYPSTTKGKEGACLPSWPSLAWVGPCMRLRLHPTMLALEVRIQEHDLEVLRGGEDRTTEGLG